MRKAACIALAALALAGGASAAVLVHRITLRPGHCVTVASTRVCAAAVSPRTVTRWRTVTEPAAPVTVPTATAARIADAYLNTGSNDTSRETTFITSYPNLSTGKEGVPPILHLVFAAPLVGNHDVQVTCHNYSSGTGTTYHVTAASGWASMYTQLPGPLCDYFLSTYEVTVWLDGSPTSVDLTYTVVQS